MGLFYAIESGIDCARGMCFLYKMLQIQSHIKRASGKRFPVQLIKCTLNCFHLQNARLYASTAPFALNESTVVFSHLPGPEVRRQPVCPEVTKIQSEKYKHEKENKVRRIIENKIIE